MKFVCLFFVLLCRFYPAPAQSHGSSDSLVKIIQVDSFTRIEVESEFPGGIPGWSQFLTHNLEYPDGAVRKNIQGTVIARFIVDTTGAISSIDIIGGPRELRQAVFDVMHKSPHWIPATMNGKKVKSYKTQPINFRLARS